MSAIETVLHTTWIVMTGALIIAFPGTVFPGV